MPFFRNVQERIIEVKIVIIFRFDLWWWHETVSSSSFHYTWFSGSEYICVAIWTFLTIPECTQIVKVAAPQTTLRAVAMVIIINRKDLCCDWHILVMAGLTDGQMRGIDGLHLHQGDLNKWMTFEKNWLNQSISVRTPRETYWAVSHF